MKQTNKYIYIQAMGFVALSKQIHSSKVNLHIIT